MITRPLGLVDRLRPPPPELDALFYVNVVLLAVFFMLFGSRFVLSPGLYVPSSAGFALPVMPGAVAGAQPTDVYIGVAGAKKVMVEDGGVMSLDQLKGWLIRRAGARRDLRLLVLGNASLSYDDMIAIYNMANAAGFAGVQFAAQPAEKN